LVSSEEVSLWGVGMVGEGGEAAVVACGLLSNALLDFWKSFGNLRGNAEDSRPEEGVNEADEEDHEKGLNTNESASLAIAIMVVRVASIPDGDIFDGKEQGATTRKNIREG